MENQRSSTKTIKDLYSWADDSLVEDIMAAVDNDITKASNLLKTMISPSSSVDNKETNVSRINSSSAVSLGDKTRDTSFPLESAADIADLSSTIEKCLKENNIEWLNGSLESVPIEPEWEEDDVYLRIRKDALRMMRSASQHSKAATNAFDRGDIFLLNSTLSRLERNDLHGLHASEAIHALHEHLENIERKILSNRSATSNRLNMERVTHSSSVESFSCMDAEKLDELQASSRQRPTSLQVITGIGNHSRGQAALPAAVRSFLRENGYRFEELRPGVITVRPKFRHR
ncbi:hypothetical protein M0R45_005253 [Rubus argutus]|uniref:Smr domain-containing protein n=1 Tax=Rubus argutus TaxID=59490 RepID=A0AAW1YM00_RUBAR